MFFVNKTEVLLINPSFYRHFQRFLGIHAPYSTSDQILLFLIYITIINSINFIISENWFVEKKSLDYCSLSIT